MAAFIHPTYTIRYQCGCVQVKQVLEATPRKRAAVVKTMESMKCVKCLDAGK